MIFWRKVSPRGAPNDPGNEPKPDRQMQAMDKRAEKIENPKEARASAGRPCNGKVWAREHVAIKIIPPFDAEFQDHERKPEEPGYRAAQDEEAVMPILGEGKARAIGEASRDEDYRVGRADCEGGFARSCVKPSLIEMARIDPGKEERAEEKHFRCQKEPHARDGRLLLVRGARILKLVRDCGLGHGCA